MIFLSSIEEKILSVLRDSKWGLTASEIAEKAKISRLTATKYLEALKAKGLIVEKKVGAYRVWFLKELSEREKSLISRKLACALAQSFIEAFGDDVKKIARKIGNVLVNQLSEEDFFTINEAEKIMFYNPYQLVASILESLSEGIKAEGIELSGGRGVLRITGELCEDREVVEVLALLLMGAVEGLVKSVTGEEPKISLRVSEGRFGYEIILEIG